MIDFTTEITYVLKKVFYKQTNKLSDQRGCPPLPEEVLPTDGYSKKKSHFFLKMWPLLGYVVNGCTSMNIGAALV